MSRRRSHGVPHTRGPLTVTRPDGTTEIVPKTVADKQARAIIRDYQMRGRQGRNM